MVNKLFLKTNGRTAKGFTIVELLIVVVVISILAAVSLVAYNGVQRSANEARLKSELNSAAKQLANHNTINGQFPSDTDDVQKSDGVTFQYTYTSGSNSYCLTASLNSMSFFISSDDSSAQVGACTGHSLPGAVADGDFIQTIAASNCPTVRTRAVDARDNHTYWVQELADGKCWMLTNLAYAGGGTNTYSDTKTLTNGTSGSTTYTTASYYVVPNTTNFTTEPTEPSTSTDGSGQYGYLYNWCAAMGAQATAACANATTPSTDAGVSICPAGWRLPTGGSGGEFTDLNTSTNGGLTNTDAGLRSSWLAQRAGTWSGGFFQQDNSGVYWSSSPSESATHSYSMFINSSVPAVYLTSSSNKYAGFAVRCIAE